MSGHSVTNDGIKQVQETKRTKENSMREGLFSTTVVSGSPRLEFGTVAG